MFLSATFSSLFVLYSLVHFVFLCILICVCLVSQLFLHIASFFCSFFCKMLLFLIIIYIDIFSIFHFLFILHSLSIHSLCSLRRFLTILNHSNYCIEITTCLLDIIDIHVKQSGISLQ